MSKSPKITGYVIGNAGRERLLVMCPYCPDEHYHGMGLGHRRPDCGGRNSRDNSDGYEIAHVEDRRSASQKGRDF